MILKNINIGDKVIKNTDNWIKNDFDGWDGDTIIKLSNGSVWEQADYQLELKLTLMPKVVIFKIGNKHFAKVDKEFFEV